MNTPEKNSQAESLSAAVGGKLARTEDGQLDVLASVGGWRGIIESFLPATVFLVVFILSSELSWALICAMAVAVLAAIARKIAGGTMMQVIAGVVGVAICALVSGTTGQARDYYLPGLYTNAAYAAGMLLSVLIRWPIIGLMYGFLRQEGTDWQQNRRRRRRYALATLLVMAVPLVRLLVQVPLYAANDVEALGISRLLMGVPLYAAALWVAWLITRQPSEQEADVAQSRPVH
ncbi:DUF3159 domain-containing protein [Micrococcoides hystricis]|uniref:DUF3159 domain-containing protein n=1 Tax=Micrococcoides hystricis TaxID=1572761 RepID=A0ABV6P736_9MICC